MLVYSEELKKQLRDLEQFRKLGVWNEKFPAWHRRTEMLFAAALGPESVKLLVRPETRGLLFGTIMSSAAYVSLLETTLGTAIEILTTEESAHHD